MVALRGGWHIAAMACHTRSPFRSRERDAELALKAAEELGIFHGTQEECLARAQLFGTERIKESMLDALQW